jgi:hypothetical protein
MIRTLDHKILSSFKEYASNKILNDLQAYKNKTVTLYENTDNRVKNKVVYSSPFAQWVYNSSVSGAQIPTVTSDAVGRPGGAIFDFVNGRVFRTTGQTGLSLTTNVSVNEINFYISSKSDERFISETKFETLYDLATANTFIQPDSVIAPCIFFKFRRTDREEIGFGGLNMNRWSVRLIAITLDLDMMTGIQNVARNMIGKHFPLLSTTPLNEFGDLKSTPWNYNTLAAAASQDSILFIEDGVFVNLEIDSFSHNNPNLLVSMATFEIKLPNSTFS